MKFNLFLLQFLGTWYEIERYYSDFQVNTKCNKIDFQYNPDGRIGILTSAIQEKYVVLSNCSLGISNSNFEIH
jgi:lipocalin